MRGSIFCAVPVFPATCQPGKTASTPVPLDTTPSKKAVNVAASTRSRSTCAGGSVWYAARPIQELGDVPFRWAHLVISAVDNPPARSYLAQQARLWGLPLIEGGFAAQRISASMFGPDKEEACWCCEGIEAEDTFSCARYALAAEGAGTIPALQTGAAAAAALVSEATLGWFHGSAPLRGRRVYGDISHGKARPLEVGVSANCVNAHRAWGPDVQVPRGTALGDTLRDAAELGLATLVLPEEVVLDAPCTKCGTITSACVPARVWAESPRCGECDGPFERSNHPTELSIRVVATRSCDGRISAVESQTAGLSAGRRALGYAEDDTPTLVEFV